MKKSFILFVLLLVSLFLTNCGQSGNSQETENLKKELEALKKSEVDDKLAKEKADLANQQDALSKEKQKLESEKKKAEAKKKEVEPVKNGEVYTSGQRVYIKISTGSLKLRSQPNENSSVLGSGTNSEAVEILEYDKTWCKVRFKGIEGFMATKFLFQGN